MMNQACPAIVLSGAVCSGKTTLAEAIAHASDAVRVSTRTILAEMVERRDRATLQDVGEKLDRECGGVWIVRGVRDLPAGRLVVVDAARTFEQVRAIAELRPAVHVHLRAPDKVLERRYAGRIAERPLDELPEWRALRRSDTELAINDLAEQAGIVLRTDGPSAAALAAAVLAVIRR